MLGICTLGIQAFFTVAGVVILWIAISRTKENPNLKLSPV
jgi:hypothetical protein